MKNFNISVDGSYLSVFCDTFNLESVMLQDPTYYKSPEISSSIDLILTNNPLSFQNSCVFETGISGFHRVTVTVMKTFFHKLQLRIINYRSCKHFENHKFREGLLSKSCNTNIKSSIYKFSGLIDVCKQASDQYALSKEIMTRTRLRNKSLKNEVNKIKKACKTMKLLRLTFQKCKKNIIAILTLKIYQIIKAFGKLLSHFYLQN